MQVMKSLIPYFILLFGNFAIAQQALNSSTEYGPGLSQKDFETAKALFVKMIYSEQYAKHNELVAKFDLKLPKDIDLASIKSPEAFKTAITGKLNGSKFESVDDAMNWMQRVIDSQLAIEETNKEYFRLMWLANQQQLHEILKPELERLRSQVGN